MKRIQVAGGVLLLMGLTGCAPYDYGNGYGHGGPGPYETRGPYAEPAYGPAPVDRRRAEHVCRIESERAGYRVEHIEHSERTERGHEVSLRLARHGESYHAHCLYEPYPDGRESARLVAVDRLGGAGGGKPNRDRVVEICRSESNRAGYHVADASRVENHGDAWKIHLHLVRSGRDYEARCVYHRDRHGHEHARLEAVRLVGERVGRDDAVHACRAEAEQAGYRVERSGAVDRRHDGFEVGMRVWRHGVYYHATCAYRQNPGGGVSVRLVGLDRARRQ